MSGEEVRTGIMICGHGSRSKAAVDEFAVLAEKLPAHLPADWPVAYGYLEFANPVIRAGLDDLRAKGCERILAVPGMLVRGHAREERHPLGAQRLRAGARNRGALRARAGRGPEDDRGRRRPRARGGRARERRAWASCRSPRPRWS